MKSSLAKQQTTSTESDARDVQVQKALAEFAALHARAIVEDHGAGLGDNAAIDRLVSKFGVDALASGALHILEQGASVDIDSNSTSPGTFVGEVFPFYIPVTAMSIRLYRPLNHALLEQGVLTKLLTRLHALNNTKCIALGAGDLLNYAVLLRVNCVKSLRLNLNVVPHPRFLAEAVRSGVIPAVMNNTPSPLIAEDSVEVIQMLHRSLVYRAVIRASESAIKTTPLATRGKPVHKRVTKAFDSFKILVGHRASVSNLFDGKKMWPCAACQGLFNREELRECSGCHSAEYCTPKCQKADWTNHKRFCRSLPPTKHSSTVINTALDMKPMGSRDRIFLNALADIHFERHFDAIRKAFLDTRDKLRNHPFAELYLQLDYRDALPVTEHDVPFLAEVFHIREGRQSRSEVGKSLIENIDHLRNAESDTEKWVTIVASCRIGNTENSVTWHRRSPRALWCEECDKDGEMGATDY